MAVAWAAELWAKGMNVWPFLAFEEERVGHLLWQTEIKGTRTGLDCDCRRGREGRVAEGDVLGNSLQCQERRVEVFRVGQGLDFSQGGGKRIFLEKGRGFTEAWQWRFSSYRAPYGHL